MEEELLLVDDLEDTLTVEDLLEGSPEVENELDPEEYAYSEGSNSGSTESLLVSINDNLITLNQSVLRVNELMSCLVFFIIATWCIGKIHHGVKGVMYHGRNSK